MTYRIELSKVVRKFLDGQDKKFVQRFLIRRYC